MILDIFSKVVEFWGNIIDINFVKQLKMFVCRFDWGQHKSIYYLIISQLHTWVEFKYVKTTFKSVVKTWFLWSDEKLNNILY